MTQVVYSTNLFRAPGFSGGPSEVYVVPSGFRAVVKCITVVWGDISGSGMDAWLQTAEGCKLMRSTWGTTGTDLVNLGGTNLYFGSWVLEPGEPLYAQTVAGTVDMQANGYELSMPSA